MEWVWVGIAAVAFMFYLPSLCYLCAKLARYGYLKANSQYHNTTCSRKECTHGRS